MVNNPDPRILILYCRYSSSETSTSLLCSVSQIQLRLCLHPRRSADAWLIINITSCTLPVSARVLRHLTICNITLTLSSALHLSTGSIQHMHHYSASRITVMHGADTIWFNLFHHTYIHFTICLFHITLQFLVFDIPFSMCSLPYYKPLCFSFYYLNIGYLSCLSQFWISVPKTKTWTCNHQEPLQFFLDFSQGTRTSKNLSFPTGPCKNLNSHFTFVSFSLKEGARKLPWVFPQVHRFTHQKKDKTPPKSLPLISFSWLPRQKVQQQEGSLFQLSQALYLSYFLFQPLGKGILSCKSTYIYIYICCFKKLWSCVGDLLKVD